MELTQNEKSAIAAFHLAKRWECEILRKIQKGKKVSVSKIEEMESAGLVASHATRLLPEWY